MDNFIGEFKNRICNREAKISVVGLGYVGLPLAVEFAKKGFKVIGIEIDNGRLDFIKRKESYICDISTKELRHVLDSGSFSATANFEALKRTDIIIICVPTPLKRKYHPDISYIKQAVNSIAKNIKKGSLIILESTTYPGTTEEVILPLLESKGLECGKDFYLAFSPERIDPGNERYPVNKIPKVIGGVTREATELTSAVYRKIINKVVPVSSARVAEVVKLLENTFRLINIGLIDELAMMANKMKIDIWEVIEAAKTKPFGFMPFYPGPGVGGHCLDKNETVFVKDGSSLRSMKMPDFIKHIESAQDNKVEVLSFDPFKGRGVFKEVTAASARVYSGRMVNVTTEDGRFLKVTELHPMFVYKGNSWQLKYAKDLQIGDCLPVCLELPRFTKQSCLNQIDIIKHKTIFKKEVYFTAVKTKDISFANGDMVYSLETTRPHSFVTSYGIAVHNCIPKDPLYLYWKARHHGFKSRFIKLASNIITYMPEYVVERVISLLNKEGKKLNKIKVLVIGVTYKKDIKDLRKSPALDIIDIFHKHNIAVSYHDPIIPYLKLNHINLKSVTLDKQKLNKFDCAIITADHSSLDYNLILENSKLIFDTRNVYRNSKNSKVVKL